MLRKPEHAAPQLADKSRAIHFPEAAHRIVDRLEVIRGDLRHRKRTATETHSNLANRGVGCVLNEDEPLAQPFELVIW